MSLDSVLHFTNFKNLESILLHGFKVQNCNELLCFQDLVPIDIAIPMVSFSDILLKDIPNQITSYGSYGIDLAKSWAVSQKINPVLYVESNSVVSEILKHQFNRVQPKEENQNLAATQEHFHLIAFMKNYEGDLTRNGKTIKNYRFYDEREWRYVASRELLFGGASFYKGPFYRANKTLLKYSPVTFLNFICSDLTHLIVTKKEEKEDLFMLLKHIYKKDSRCDLDFLYNIITII